MSLDYGTRLRPLVGKALSRKLPDAVAEMPEGKLWFAVLIQAIQDARSPDEWQHFADSVSCRKICFALGLEVDFVDAVVRDMFAFLDKHNLTLSASVKDLSFLDAA